MDRRSNFELGEKSGQVPVWRKKHEFDDPECLAPTFKSGRSPQMVWGGVIHDQKTELALFQEIGGNERSCRRKSEDFIELELGIKKLDWPAQSADLNPVENLWRKMKARVSAKFERHRGGRTGKSKVVSKENGYTGESPPFAGPSTAVVPRGSSAHSFGTVSKPVNEKTLTARPEEYFAYLYVILQDIERYNSGQLGRVGEVYTEPSKHRAYSVIKDLPECDVLNRRYRSRLVRRIVDVVTESSPARSLVVDRLSLPFLRVFSLVPTYHFRHVTIDMQTLRAILNRINFPSPPLDQADCSLAGIFNFCNIRYDSHNEDLQEPEELFTNVVRAERLILCSLVEDTKHYQI
ncbi:uncharacterized protein BYT42DRAFT_615886 [Radiomyces spectabilis]|uniref:uncharacterized protein n=1 Tax=Radiomyces spectabilis TaxID=64574 RepID=UPI002220CAB3|nr:uncharacterized protein BYT42DRAFT_615886 [Radiomyces spectabilis]KAI8374762.1 hypothetical protein BYT42DRAFT_615886 [Radiomyces spectabilis]